MTLLRYYSSDDLKAELIRREAKDAEKPVPLDSIDIEPLKDICKLRIQELVERTQDTDTKHLIYETAMECVFGKSVWEWINNRS